MKLLIGVLVLYAASVLGAFAQERVEATTAKGERVFLFPNGRWEFADQPKAQVQREERRVEDERERGGQGGFLGFGRRIFEGDKDYNRGSLNPNRR
ncbi:MAG: hypothetical protein EXR28_10135 [Betaproteobacteria bacterium]|nr:hypothetical protein [Betaproteobacteria bacterium]